MQRRVARRLGLRGEAGAQYPGHHLLLELPMSLTPLSLGQPRAVTRVIEGLPASDGAGVKLTRVIGQPQLDQLDPFLLLDEFRSDTPGDYIGGFPDHPHRGFETVTYMLAGRMRHRDSAG